MAAAERRKPEQAQQIRAPSSHGLPSIHQQQSAMAQVPGPGSTLPSHSSLARPGLERAHTFPTPPTSASSAIGGGMSAQDGFNWQGQGINGQQVTTPPGTSMQSLQSYPPSAHAGYDSQRQMYNAPSTQQSPYQSANSSSDRLYSQSAKPNGTIPSDPAAPQQPGEEEGDHEQDPEYTHDSGSYDPTRASYNYSAPALPSDNSNMPPEMTGSPNHPPTSGRATPRTAAQPQSYYQHTGYSTPPRVQQSSSLYNVMSNDRPASNGAAPAGDVYAPPGEMPAMTNGYAPRAPVLNGAGAGAKRGRDDDEVSNAGAIDPKRRKMMETAVPAPVYDAMNQSASAVGAPPRR